MKEEKTKRQLQNEIKEIIDNAKKQASEMKKQIITQAEKEALLIKEKAKSSQDYNLFAPFMSYYYLTRNRVMDFHGMENAARHNLLEQ